MGFRVCWFCTRSSAPVGTWSGCPPRLRGSASKQVWVLLVRTGWDRFRSRGRVLNQLCARADVPEPRCCFWFLHGFSATFPPQPAGPNWTSGSGAIYLCSEKVLVPPLVGGVTGQDCTQRRSPGQNQEAQDPVRVQFGPV